MNAGTEFEPLVRTTSRHDAYQQSGEEKPHFPEYPFTSDSISNRSCFAALGAIGALAIASTAGPVLGCLAGANVISWPWIFIPGSAAAASSAASVALCCNVSSRNDANKKMTRQRVIAALGIDTLNALPQANTLDSGNVVDPNTMTSDVMVLKGGNDREKPIVGIAIRCIGHYGTNETLKSSWINVYSFESYYSKFSYTGSSSKCPTYVKGSITDRELIALQQRVLKK